jgi:hypothetical protein
MRQRVDINFKYLQGIFDLARFKYFLLHVKNN